MKWLSLFSGIGGFDLALQRAGQEIVGACEIDEYARRIYAEHFPGVKIYGDVTKIDPEQLPEIDGIVAGFPCQTFSIAGKRLGFKESRGELFFEIARIAKQKRPRYLLLENVKGLLSHDNGETFAVILNTLDELGYDAEWQVLNSKYFVPQNRERIFIIAYLRTEPRPEVFPIHEVSGISNSEDDRKQKGGKGIRSEDIASTIDSRYGALRNSGETYLQQVGNIDKKGHNSIWGRVYDPDGIAPNLNAEGGGLGAKTGLFAVPVLTPDRPEKRQNGRRFKEDGDPMFTLTAQDKHGVLTSPKHFNMTEHNGSRVYDVSGPSSSLMSDNGTGSRIKIQDGVKIRRLTPTECERLQGFPDGWTEGISDTQRYKCLGNAVTVNVIEFLGKKLYEVYS